MPAQNAEIASRLDQTSELSELKGDKPFPCMGPAGFTVQ